MRSADGPAADTPARERRRRRGPSGDRRRRAEILAAGGTAADAAVAASLASCAAETIDDRAARRRARDLLGRGLGSARNLDFFVAVPGLGAPAREPDVLQLAVPFGEELVHYAVGPATCAVPGVPAGLDALWRAHGRLPWARLVEPALRIARDGALMTPAHAAVLAMLAPVFRMHEGARIYAPAGRSCREATRSCSRSSHRAFEAIAADGAAAVYSGPIATALLALSDERGGLITRDDLAATRRTGASRSRCPTSAAACSRAAASRRSRACSPGSRGSPASARRARRRAGGGARRPPDARRPHHEPRHRRRRWQRLRPHDDAGARLGRLAPGSTST